MEHNSNSSRPKIRSDIRSEAKYLRQNKWCVGLRALIFEATPILMAGIS